MATVNFPNSPSNGQTLTTNTGITYTYNSSKARWDATTGYVTASALDNYLQVANASSGSTVTTYSSNTVFPSSGNANGALAFSNSTGDLFVWNGSQWDKIAHGVDESPVILSEPVSSVTLNADGSNSSVTMLATDPEGFTITYGIAYNNATNSLPAQLISAPTISSNGVYTFTPTSNTSLEGSFKARLSASDGANITTRLVDFDLAFWATVSGGTTTQAGGYIYHTFTSSGTLSVSQTGTVEYIVVAGGGGGGGHAGGAGGGGGGVRYGTMLVNAGSVTVTVGNGGSGSGSTSGSNGGTGGDSVLGSTTASGGGAGAGHAGAAGDGGSGGGQAGGGATGPGSGNAGSYSPAEGNDGGAFGATGYAAGGGGGGAGAAGQDSGVNASSDGGNGGAGYLWVDGNYYGGGGGGGSHHSGGSGGTGGQGGGGAGANGGSTNGGAGTTNTGGGGGGAGGLNGSFAGSGGAGGSGIVIVRVAA